MDLNCKLCFSSPASTPSSSCFRRHHHHVPLLFSSDHHQHLHFPLAVAGTVTVSLSLMLVLLPIAVAFQSPLPATSISTSRRSSRHQLSFSSSRSCCVLLGKQKAPLLRWISGDLRWVSVLFLRLFRWAQQLQALIQVGVWSKFCFGLAFVQISY